ncbi:MAG: hypothetical protein HDR26_08265 [Lachnospiraceae bacterium]|nr:hypothetical protein [Lachnospiraceae bacterium]
MKKMGSILLAAVMLFLTACGGKEAEVPYIPGVFTGAGYESEYVGYRFTAPVGCTVLSREEKEKLTGIVIETAGEDAEALQEAYADQTVIYDLIASMPGGANVNVVCSKRGTNGMTSDQLVKELKKQLAASPAMDAALSGSYKAVPSETYEEVSFAGGNYTKVTAEVTVGEIRMNQEYYVCIKPGYVVNITFTYAPGNEADRDALAGAFSAY